MARLAARSETNPLTRGGWRGVAANLALLLASLLLSCLGAEWFLRHYFPEAGTVLRVDPLYHYGLIPNSRKLFRHSLGNGGGRVLVTVNSRGFRGSELEDRPALRVAVYGDSSIFAAFSHLDETFPVRLDHDLERALRKPVEVVNAGVEGYGPCQALLRLEGELETLRPNLIVFPVFADNDFGDLVRNKLFALDGGGRLVEGGGILGPAVLRSFETAENRTPIHLFRGLWRLWRGRTRASIAREDEAAGTARPADRQVHRSVPRRVRGGRRAPAALGDEALRGSLRRRSGLLALLSRRQVQEGVARGGTRPVGPDLEDGRRSRRRDGHSLSHRCL